MDELKLAFLIQLFCLFIGSQTEEIVGIETGDCYIESITDDEWKNQKVFQDHIKKNETNKIILESTYKNIKEVKGCTSTNCFFEADIVEDSIQIRSNENLLDIDKQGHTVSKSKKISTSISFICANDGMRTLSFQINVDDVNIHAPEFSSKTGYEYSLPMPIPPGINLMEFGEALAANDEDFSNTGMTFTIDSNDLSCTMVKNESANFPYTLRLEFRKVTRLSGDTKYNIKAEDSGLPSKSSTTQIVFKIDEKNSEPYLPAFTKPSFLFNYNLDDVTVAPKEGEDITLVDEGKSEVKCKLSDDLGSYFYDPEVHNKNIDIRLKKKLPDRRFVTTITLSCYVNPEYHNEADIIIEMPEDNLEAIKFSKNMYSANYSTNGVAMTDFIKINNYEEDVFIKVEYKYSTYFEVTKIANDKSQWYLVLNKDLDVSFLKNTYLNIFINLIIDEKILDKAAIVLLLPNGETGVEFIMPIVDGKYTFDAEDVGNLEIEGQITTNSEDIDIVSETLVGDYSDYFKVGFKAPNSFLVEKAKELPSTILKDYVLPLTLKVEYRADSIVKMIQTVILLYLSKDTSTTDATSTESSRSSTAPISTTTNSSSDECEGSNTVWIIVVIVLCILMVSYVAATVFYYLRRIRGRRSDQHTFTPTEEDNQIHFQKKDSLDTSKYKDISTRRPTGFIRFNPNMLDLDRDQELEENTAANRFVDVPEENFRTIPENDKKVDFEDKEEKLAPLSTMTLAEELKKAVEERENRLI